MTHRFHPLCGQRLPVLFVKKRAGGLVFVCEGGPDGRASVTLPQSWTDRGMPALEHRLSAESLTELAGLVTAISERHNLKADVGQGEREVTA